LRYQLVGENVLAKTRIAQGEITIMTEEKIVCHQCGKELVMKFIELKDLVFCSSSCFESFKPSMSRKDFFKNYGDGFTPDEQKSKNRGRCSKITKTSQVYL
jgi:hypothetical protein